ncbi:MAG: Crp/Fnr family transcriptional regulator [Caldimonas sp.]
MLSQVLATPDDPVTHVYFPIESFVSLLTVVSGEVGLEVGMVGREGMLGAQLSLGVTAAPLHALVQGAGSAWRCEAPAFLEELERSAALRREIGLYVYVLMTQLATSAGCARYHEIQPRLARWLLMSQDRARSDTFSMTQEFMGFMLGVRRVGITAAAGALQRAGLIEYERGRLTVLDRSGLEAAACTCFATDRKSYAELLSGDQA